MYSGVFRGLHRKEFLRIQICAWGIQGANMLIMALSFSFHWQTLWTEAVNIFVLAAASQGILMAACRWDWFSAGWRPLLLRGLTGCVSGGTLTSIVLYPLSRAENDGGYSLPWALLAIDSVWNTCILSTWGGFFLAFYFHDRHQRLEIERALMAAAVQEAQLASLKSQINPHFLFNSFNLLRSLIQKESGLAREAVTHLAGMMRFSLAMANRSTIRLADELEFVEAFLALERLRYEERLRVQARVAADIGEEPIPPMLLQTLVENAVKHGIDQDIDGVDVAYAVWKDRTGVHVRVTNSGRLRETSDSTGTGLRNARTRLQLLYGDDAFLNVNQDNSRVVAEAAWPATRGRF